MLPATRSYIECENFNVTDYWWNHRNWDQLKEVALLYNTTLINMVPTAKEIVFSRTFPGQNYHFSGRSIQDLKVINQDMCEKAYHIYSMIDWLTFIWYNLLFTYSSCLIHPFLSRLCISTIFLLQLRFSSTGIIFIHVRIFFYLNFFPGRFLIL